MKIEQIYTGCLAQGAYYIESDGEVAIIDPLRETQQYVEKADKENAKIKFILETHFHADFVSGHVDLAKKTGAKIVYGPGANTSYDIHQAADGEILKLGKIQIKVLHTPGHTLESSCFLLLDENGTQQALFSGDTLFIGDVGRPDLAIRSDLTQFDLAGLLFDSLRNKVMTLNDGVIVYPAHGAGSACGKNMSSETWDTLGHQKLTNYALRADMTRDEFIKEVTTGILPPPQYFAKNAMMNKTGYESLDSVMKRGSVPLDSDTFESIANHEGALVLDTRSKEDYSSSHIPNSIFIGADGSFAPWVGALIPDLDQPIIFVAYEGKEEEMVIRLSRVGYDNTMGYLDGGIEAWKNEGRETDSVNSVSAQELAKMASDNPLVIDCRKPGEFEAQSVKGAVSIPLDFLNDKFSEIDRGQTAYVHCKSGYRSLIFTSIMKARGYKNIVDILGGMAAIEQTDMPLEKFVCSSKKV
jgi:hydroxyacylglutathione hydrolase